jgi:hypothetical protein
MNRGFDTERTLTRYIYGSDELVNLALKTYAEGAYSLRWRRRLSEEMRDWARETAFPFSGSWEIESD